MNKVTIGGKVGRVEFKDIGAGLLKFSVVTKKRYKKKDGQWAEAETWHDVSIWGREASYYKDRIAKGDTVVVGGSISKRKDKQERIWVTIDAEEILVATGAGKGAQRGAGMYQERSGGGSGDDYAGDYDEPSEYEDDGIPF